MNHYKLHLKTTQHWLVILIPGFFYMVQTAFSVIAVLLVRLQHDFSVNYFQISLFETLYILCYILMQIPAGLLLDKFPTNRLIAVAILTYSIALIFLGKTHSYDEALVCWIFMGTSSSFSFLGALKLANSKLSSRQYPFAVGILETLMAISAIFSMYLFQYVEHGNDWRNLFEYIAFILLPFSLLAIVFAKVPAHIKKQPMKSTVSSLLTVLANKRIWALILYIGFISASLVVLTNNWQIYMLKKIYHIKGGDAITINAMVLLGYVMGALHGSLYRRRFGMRRTLIIAAFAKLGALVVGIYATSQALLAISLFANGFIIGLSLLCFTIVKEWTPNDHQSVVTASVNMASEGIGIVVLPLTSFLLDVTQQNFYLAVIPLYIANFVVIAVSFAIKEPVKNELK